MTRTQEAIELCADLIRLHLRSLDDQDELEVLGYIEQYARLRVDAFVEENQ